MHSSKESLSEGRTESLDCRKGYEEEELSYLILSYSF